MQLKNLAAPVFCALTLVACSADGPASTDNTLGPSLSLIPRPAGPGIGERVVVCKEGGAGTYEFTYSGTNNVQGNFFLEPGQCWLLGEYGTTGTTMSITEVPREGHEVVSIAVDQAVIDDQFVTGTNTVTGVVARGNPRDAALVTFTNRVLPDDPTEDPGTEGCTPGYWKNHTDSWTTYTTSQTAGSVFELGSYPTHAGKTLLQTLDGGGGSGVDGALKTLLRAATAALLNADNPDVDYTMTSADIIDDVNEAIATGDRATILALAASLDADNNLGCPIN
jgi:hypothetical protein